MRKMKRLFSLLLVFCLLFSLVACGDKKEDNKPAEDGVTNGAEATSSPDETAIDTTKKVDLVFYMLGDAPGDEAVVEDAINKILLEKVNATVDFQFSTWTDFQQKYNLALTSGSADLLYIANWNNYATLANSGAYLDLTEELLNTYAPDIATSLDANLLEQCKINGSLYSIPGTWPEYTSNGISYREDLRVKYDLPVPNSIENLETYLLGIKENEPSMQLLQPAASDALDVAFDAVQILNLKYPWVTMNGLPYGLAADYSTPSDVYEYWNSEDFVTDMKLMKKWADNGFWSRSALSDAGDAEAFNNGMVAAAVAGQNPSKDAGATTAFTKNHPDWENAFIAYGEVTGAIYPSHGTQNATAIAASSKNPERALMVLNLFLFDQELNDLVEYGIKGTHYDVVDGVYKNLSENFKYEGFNSWNLRNKDFKLPQETDTLLSEKFTKYEEIGKATKFPNVNIFGGFAEDYSTYDVERSAVSEVMRQYLAPLQAGLVDDVDAAVAEFRQKVTDAGLAVCQEGFKQQWLAYCEEHGYK